MYLLEDLLAQNYRKISFNYPSNLSLPVRLENFAVEISLLVLLVVTTDAIGGRPPCVFNIFLIQSDGPKRYLCILLDAFVTTGA